MKNTTLQKTLEVSAPCLDIRAEEKPVTAIRARWCPGDFGGRRRCPYLGAKAADPLRRIKASEGKGLPSHTT